MRDKLQGLKKLGSLTILCLLVVALAPASSWCGVVEDFSNALKSGKPTLELRLSYEYSNYHDTAYPIKHPANEISLRTRVGYRTGEFLKTTAYIQLQNVTNFLEDFRYKRGYPTGDWKGDTSHDVILDPDGSRVQQAYLDIKFLPQTLIRLGRQEILLDDQRLIGNINWRQNGQSFDAVTVTNQTIPNLELFAGYVNQVNTILLGHMDLDGLYLFHATYTGIKKQKISAFVYLLDTEDNSPSARDCATYGIRATGKISMIRYAIDYAYQGDFQDGEDHNGHMFNAFVGTKLGMANLGAGYSYISGRDGNDRPFDTLFSTAHKFNGWADQFASTNGGTWNPGLQDFYVQAGTKYMDIKFLAVYHYFDSTNESGQFDGTLGDEIDLLALKKFTKNLSGLLKFAYYSQNDAEANGMPNPTKDETVFWARLMYKF